MPSIFYNKTNRDNTQKAFKRGKSKMAGEKKGFQIPHVFVILFLMIIIATIMTYFVPAGTFVRVKNSLGNTMVDPNSFHYVKQNPISFLSIPMYVAKSLISSSTIIWMLVTGTGAAEVALATGAFDVGIKIMINKFKNRQMLLLVGTIILFGIYGMRQNPVGMVGFVPILILFCRLCGFDAMVAVAIIIAAAGCCQSIGPVAPATTMVAQSIAELPIFSGIGYRLFVCAVFLFATTLYIVRYAKMVQAHPEKSLVRNMEEEWKKTRKADADMMETPKMTIWQGLVIIAFIALTILQVYGGIFWKWKNVETSAQFILMAIICGLLGRLSPSQIARSFSKGAEKMMVAGLMIGIATSIAKILTDGKIIDTIVLSIATVLSYAPGFLQGPIMFIANVLINIFIPSGSGQAATVMPLFIPVADIIGMTRQTCVLAFNCGDGLGNYFLPQSSALMANLMVAGISYSTWMKFFGKLFGIWFVLACVACSLAQIFHYGPF